MIPYGLVSSEGHGWNHKDYTFLVVEDNLLMLTMVVNMLADIGYQ